MRLRARNVTASESPANIRLYLGQSFIAPGKEYEVHALAVFRGVTAVQVVDDIDMPSWRPAWLFDVVDRSLADDWVINLFHEEPSLVMGPDFIARDVESYNAMVDLDEDQLDRFWKRIALREAQARGPDDGDG
ncbi:MAG: hypothetical protein WBY94_29120 [Polyangiaceae bacterium]